MADQPKPLEELVKELSPELQQQVRDFVEFLLSRQTKRCKRKPTFDWAGALADTRNEYTSVELQHKIADWIAGEE